MKGSVPFSSIITTFESRMHFDELWRSAFRKRKQFRDVVSVVRQRFRSNKRTRSFTLIEES